ncbi:uncharacterized protein LOC134828946 [Culicoides brevitarsis]|uniref:uncharacterized protein LOC134828946 n=1 Tax=Culicoides brevitarsis TaxID=469753 RepID=UPI00307C3643
MYHREPIPSTDWASLRDLFLIEWPKHIVSYSLLQNYITWLTKDPKYVKENVEIYSLNGDWKDGTFYLVDDSYLFFDSLDADNMRLEILLDMSLDKTKTYRCRSVNDCHLSILNRVIQRLGMKKSYEMDGLMVHTPREFILTFPDPTPPDGVYFASLNPKHAKLIASFYPLRDQSTPGLFDRTIRLNTTLGAFEKETGKLIGWCMQFQSGEMTALQIIDKKWLRSGLGGLIVVAASRKVALLGSDFFAVIDSNNVASKKFMAKQREMGIIVNIIGTTHHIVFGPEKRKAFS